MPTHIAGGGKGLVARKRVGKQLAGNLHHSGNKLDRYIATVILMNEVS
jgi:hypothetical protein